MNLNLGEPVNYDKHGFKHGYKHIIVYNFISFRIFHSEARGLVAPLTLQHLGCHKGHSSAGLQAPGILRGNSDLKCMKQIKSSNYILKTEFYNYHRQHTHAYMVNIYIYYHRHKHVYIYII